MATKLLKHLDMTWVHNFKKRRRAIFINGTWMILSIPAVICGITI